jgi:hypothetical protein
VLPNTRLNIRDDRIKMSVQLYHNASISRVPRWTLKHAQFFSVKLPKANRCKKTKPNEFLFNGLVRSVLWNETVQRAAAAIDSRNEMNGRRKTC